jgi:hypothetical protein
MTGPREKFTASGDEGSPTCNGGSRPHHQVPSARPGVLCRVSQSSSDRGRHLRSRRKRFWKRLHEQGMHSALRRHQAPRGASPKQRSSRTNRQLERDLCGKGTVSEGCDHPTTDPAYPNPIHRGEGGRTLTFSGVHWHLRAFHGSSQSVSHPKTRQEVPKTRPHWH